MQHNITIALDMMSGDHDVESTVPAAFEILKKHNDLSLILVGDNDRIRSLMTEEMKKFEGNRYTIHHTKEFINFEQNLLQKYKIHEFLFLSILILSSVFHNH